MIIKRELETTNAKYSIDDLTHQQFTFLINSMERTFEYTHRCIPDKESGEPIAEMYHKLKEMRDSSVTIIK